MPGPGESSGMERTKRISFSPGDTSATVEGALVRGDRDSYLLGAQSGQQMWVHIASVENNAVFAVYEPGSERTLPGAGERDDATDWSGELPTSGDYKVTVGGTRGNASYTLEVSIV